MTERPPVQFKLRLPWELHARLERAAEISGHSVTADIVKRLMDSFPADFEQMVILSLQVDIERYQQQISDLRSFLTERGDSMTPDAKTAALRLIARAEENWRRTVEELDAITLQPPTGRARNLGFK